MLYKSRTNLSEMEKLKNLLLAFQNQLREEKESKEQRRKEEKGAEKQR